jgi:4a-hydroxytetrahydrobiopterin dehydratase
MTVLDDSAIREGLDRLDGWTRDGNAINRTFEFDSFMPAIAFVNRVAEAAETADHHPDIDIRYSRVTLALSTHSAGGITRKDLNLAGEIDSLAG